MKEPLRRNELSEVASWLQERVGLIIHRMNARGFDAILWETYRSKERQKWLYGQGRSKARCILAGISPAYSHPGPIVTHTLKSRHMVRKAADIISRSRGWNWPEFYVALKEEAMKVGMHTLSFEGCHVEW